MKFRSRNDLFVQLMIWGAIAVMLFSLYPEMGRNINAAGIAVIIFCLMITALLLWILFGTWYIIDEKYVTYRSGPFHGKIEIEKIHTVIFGKNIYVGFRPATARKGLIVKYGKYDEIYMSPHTNEPFIAALLQKNPKIKIEKYGN